MATNDDDDQEERLDMHVVPAPPGQVAVVVEVSPHESGDDPVTEDDVAVVHHAVLAWQIGYFCRRPLLADCHVGMYPSTYVLIAEPDGKLYDLDNMAWYVDEAEAVREIVAMLETQRRLDCERARVKAAMVATSGHA